MPSLTRLYKLINLIFLIDADRFIQFTELAGSDEMVCVKINKFIFLLFTYFGLLTVRIFGNLSNCSLSSVINSVPNRKETAA